MTTITHPRIASAFLTTCAILTLGGEAAGGLPPAPVPPVLSPPTREVDVAGKAWIQAPASPELAAVVPSAGPTFGETWVEITGQGIAAGAAVRFGDTPATATEWISASRIRAQTPPAAAGAVDVVVENRPGYEGRLVGGFTYLSPPPQMIPRQFDALDLSLNDGDGYKNSNNESALLAWGESYILMAYLAAYDATADLYYLHKLVDHADAVLANRDDFRGVQDYRGISGPCWINRHYQNDGSPYCYVVHSGMITYPMVRFATVVYDDPSLWDVVTYDNSTFADKADLYVTRAEETVAHHEWQWRNGPAADEGYYIFAPDAPGGIPAGQNLPSNQQNALGRTLVALYEATGDPAYLDKVERMSRLFLRATALDGEAYVWDYWNLIGDTRYDGPGEDISHAALNVDFVVQAAESGIVFNDTDMGRFVHTFTDNVTADEAEVYDRIDGTGGPGTYELQTGRWLNLEPWDAVGSIYFTTQGVYEDLFDWTNTGSGSLLFGCANLARWEGGLETRGVYTGMGPASDWAGAAGADLDGDGVDEICAIRNFDGSLYAWSFREADGSVTSWGYNNTFDPASDWRGLAAADLDQDGSDELVAVRGLDSQIYFIDSGRGTLFEVWHTTGWGSASDWAGVGAGHFSDGDHDWVALARNFDGHIYLADYDLSGGGGVRASNTGFGSASDWADLVVGDFDGDGLGEIFAARNFDAHLFVLDHQGTALPIVAEISGFGPASDWAAVGAADLDGDGVDEMLATRNFDGRTYAWKLVSGQPVAFGSYTRYGATYTSGPMAGGRFTRAWNGDLLSVLSNRTGNLHLYGVR